MKTKIFLILHILVFSILTCLGQSSDKVYESISKVHLSNFKGNLESSQTLYKYALTLRNDSTFSFLSCKKLAKNTDFVFDSLLIKGTYQISKKCLMLVCNKDKNCKIDPNLKLLYKRNHIIMRGNNLNKIRLNLR